MLNQDEYFSNSEDRASTSSGVPNSNLATEENNTLHAASSENPNTNLFDASCTQHLPCTIQGIVETVAPNRQKTHRRSAPSFSHFLSREMPSSDEQIIFEFFLDVYESKSIATACTQRLLHSINSPTPPTPKSSPSPPPPSQESLSDSNAPGRSCNARSVAQEPPSD